MSIVIAALLAAASWFGWRFLKRRIAASDPRLSMVYWRNSLIVVVAYIVFILVGGFVTRIMVGFSPGALPQAFLVGFFVIWMVYGGLWVWRLLPTTKTLPDWLVSSRGWLDAALILLLLALVIGARLV